MRVKLIGVSDKTRKSESVARERDHRRGFIATALLHTAKWYIGAAAVAQNADSPHPSSVNTFEEQMTLKEPAAEISANLEYPACPLCGNDRRNFPFRLHEPYRVARCLECGFHFLYPRLMESAMQEIYRESSYYEGGACGYADTSYAAQESALRATFKRFLHNLADRRLTGGTLLEVGCGYGYLLDEARPYFDHRVGTEFSVEGAEIARATGAEVFVGGIEQISAEHKFDCILAIQVIEHVYQPSAFVKQLINHTQSQGHLI